MNLFVPDEHETQPRRIRFKFRAEKFADAMAFLAERVPDLSALKAAKLLYLCDREHLLRQGRPILGDWYACMEHGPVPAVAFDMMKQLRDPEKKIRAHGIGLVEKRIKLKRLSKHPVFKRRDKAPLEALSQSELDVLDEIARTYGDKDPYELADITHTHTAWQVAYRADEHVMDYRLFFKDVPGHEAMLELMESDQEDRDFIAQL